MNKKYVGGRSMSSYLKNNLELIMKYENFYKDEFDIDAIKNNLVEKKIDFELKDLYMFRVFLDSCVLLFNKEKFEKQYFKDLYDTKGYIKKNKDKYNSLIDFIESIFRNKLKVEDAFYYDYHVLEKKYFTKSLWESRKILRNAFAHMQYIKKFCQLEYDGRILYYEIFNKDKGVVKNQGIVIEILCHEFIQYFYLNQMTKSIAYKHSWVEKKWLNFFLKEVRYKGEQKYSVENRMHPMNNEVFSNENFKRREVFLKNNPDEFEIKCRKFSYSEIIKLKKTLSKYLGRKSTIDELGYFIKSIYDVETEFSNFMTHLIQLNDRIIDFLSYSKVGNKEMLLKILKSIDELKEDYASWLEFKIFFKFLYIINFSLRIEDKDLAPISYSNVIIENFEYDRDQRNNFVRKKIEEGSIENDKEDEADIIYILTKIRNAIAHGRMSLEIIDEKICFVFEDKFRDKRIEKIKICFDDVDVFLQSINSLV